MNRIYRPISELLKEAHECGFPKDFGLAACYEIENMGFCKDNVTRWYHLTDLDGRKIYTLKR